jgi:Tol biopolymer transport system component
MRRLFGLGMTVLTGIVAFPGVAQAAEPSVVRVSVTPDGGQADGHSSPAAVSADGRVVTFTSAATDLTPVVTGRSQVYARPDGGATELVSVSLTGKGGRGDSAEVSSSADGRYVVFWSSAADLVPDDTNGVADIFVRDRIEGVTTRVSVAADGAHSTAGSSDPAISADGRFVVFSSAAVLAPGSSGTRSKVYVRDLQAGTTAEVSVRPNGSSATLASNEPSISADGRYIAFSSGDQSLAPGGLPFGSQTPYVRDMVAGTTTRVAVNAAGEPTSVYVRHGSSVHVSADGRYVTYATDSRGVVPGDQNSRTDIFRWDRTTGLPEWVTEGADAASNALVSVSSPTTSADGRFVMFDSKASNLVPDDTNGKDDVFVKDMVTGTVRRVSVPADGGPADGASYAGRSGLSADGTVAAFSSEARLVPDDKRHSDAYLSRLG